MSDIVERLRQPRVELGPLTTGSGRPVLPHYQVTHHPPAIQLEAADEIERLRAQVAPEATP